MSKLLMIIFTLSSAWASPYLLPILKRSTTIVTNGASRNWSDGSYATTCDGYIHPTTGHSYSGSTGSGVYTIVPSGTPVSAWCDMSDNGGGWTLVSNAAQVTATFSSSFGTTTTTNFDAKTQMPNWGTTDKMVTVNGASPSVFTYSSANHWVLGPYTLVGGGTSNLRYSGNADSAWTLNNAPYNFLGPADHGAWCDGSTAQIVYMNNLAYGPAGVHPGVQESQGGCDDNYNWKDDFSWQVFSK